jgi:hypothetical protein
MVVNHANHVVPVVMNQVVLCWASRWESRIERCASRCESCCAMLSQSLWIAMCYAEPVVVNHWELWWASGCESWCVMLSRVCGNHGVLCWTSGWESRCECCASGCASLCYAEPVVVNHSVLCCASRCEPWRVMRRQWLWIMLCYYVPVGVILGALC